MKYNVFLEKKELKHLDNLDNKVRDSILGKIRLLKKGFSPELI